MGQMVNSTILIHIFIASLLLGLIKFGSLSDAYKGKPWQLKFIEIWNDFINFFVAGLIGYYFVLIKWPMIIEGEKLDTGDIFLLVIFLFGLFGHLCVLSKNLTENIQDFIKKYLESKPHTPSGS